MKKSFKDYFRAIEMDGLETESFNFGSYGRVDYYAVIELAPDDYAAFPDDIEAIHTHVVIHHDNYGFVDVSAVKQDDIVSLRGEHDSFYEEMDALD